MSGNGQSFVEWKEEFVSQERGSRVVHYFLKDSAGDCILAVVGTERSVRHMSYVVADEFVQDFGLESSVHSGFKWRSRREVVDWLTSMLSKKNCPEEDQDLLLKSPRHDKTPASTFSDCPVNCLAHSNAGVPDDMGCRTRNFTGHNSDIAWLGTAWTCGKRLKHYPAFCRNGTKIAVQSFVFVMAKGENHYVAYLEDMYEDKKGQKKVKVRWFHHNKEVKGVIPLRTAHPKEVFITPYVQVISVECVDGPATVLTREHYKKCLSTLPDSLSSRIHLCFRQFKNNRVKSFDLSKLRGYLDQPLVRCLGNNFPPRPGSACHGYSGEEDEGLRSVDNVKRGGKRSRGSRGLKVAADLAGFRMFCGSYQMMPYQTSRLNMSNDLLSSKLPGPKSVNCQQSYPPPFKIDEKIELLCQDSGIRGCWFRCTVFQVSRKWIKVIYDDLQDEDGSGNLQEWVPAMKVALPDKFGMRCLGRPTIRPPPTPSKHTDDVLEIGSAVDAWWSDGWWEGVVTGIDSSTDVVPQIYLPGENLFLSIHRKDIRVSRDWVGGQWIDVKPKPDILSAISTDISQGTKFSTSSTIAKDAKSEDTSMANVQIPTNSMHEVACEEKPIFTPATNADGLLENENLVSDVSLPSIKAKSTGDNSDNISERQDTLGDSQGSVDDDKHEHAGDDRGKVAMEITEIPKQNCNEVEPMEVEA